MGHDHSTRPFAYFDPNGGDFPWFLREVDGTESTYATLSEAVTEGFKLSQGVDVYSESQSRDVTPYDAGRAAD